MTSDDRTFGKNPIYWDKEHNIIGEINNIEITNIDVDVIEATTSISTPLMTSPNQNVIFDKGITINANEPVFGSVIIYANKNYVADDYLDLSLLDQGIRSLGFGRDLVSNGSNGYLWNYRNTDLYFGTNDLERLRIESTGESNFKTNSQTNVNDVGCTTVTAVTSVSTPTLTSPNATISVSKGIALTTNAITQTSGTFTQTTGSISTPTLTSPNATLSVSKPVDLTTNAITQTSGTFTQTTGSISTPTLTSPNTTLSVSKPIDLGTSSGNPLTGKKISIYNTLNDWRYYGIYTGSGYFGFELESTTAYYQFSSGLTGSTKHDIIELKGTGGIKVYDYLSLPGAVSGSSTMYATGGQMRVVNSSGEVIRITRSFVGELYMKDNATVTALTADITKFYSIQGTFSSQLSADFTDTSSTFGGGNRLTYGSTPTRLAKVSVSVSADVSTVLSTLRFAVYKNATVDGADLITGTQLNYIAKHHIATVGPSSAICFTLHVSLATNDTLTLGCSSDTATNLVVSQFNMNVIALSAGTD